MTIDLRDQLKQKKQAYVQDEILGSAAALFAERGFRAITITDIAAGLGYTKSVVYYYFKNKNEILWQIFVRMHDTYQASIDHILSKNLPVEEALRRILHSHAVNVMKQKDWTAIYFRGEIELEEEQRLEIRQRKRDYDAKIEVVYQQGIREKVFKDLHPHIVISGYVGMCNWLHIWFREDGSHTAEQIADYYVDVMIGGYLR